MSYLHKQHEIPLPPSLMNIQMKSVKNYEITEWTFGYDLNRINKSINFFLGNNYFLYYIETPFLLQCGPQCGIVSLTLACLLYGKDVTTSEVLQKSRLLNFTKQGEMFSCLNMYELAKCYFEESQLKLLTSLNNDNINLIINSLKNNYLVLFPYDKGPDNGPILRNGYSAHWSLLTGYASNENESVVLVRHGKSKWTGVYKWSDMLASNRNLSSVSPKLTNTNDLITIPFMLANSAIIIKLKKHNNSL